MLMRVLDRTGDTKHVWNPEVEAEVEAARALFTTLTGKRYRAFTVPEDGEAARRLDRFDPSIGEMVFVPQLVGG